MKNLIFFILSLILFSCSPQSENDPDTFLFDPEIPGGSTDGANSVLPLNSIQYNSSTLGQFEFRWSIPANYENVDYHVSVFKVFADGVDNDLEISDPSTQIGVFTYEVVRIKNGTTWIDTNVSPGQDYFYWFFLVLEGEDLINSTEGKWSSSSKYYLLAPTSENEISIPNSEDFWDNIAWSNVLIKKDDETLINSFEEQISTKDIPKGRIRDYPEHGLSFIMDKHRILILENSAIKNCNNITDAIAKDICLLSAINSPPSIKNVLGQVDMYTNKSCEEYNNDCTTLLNKNDCETNRMCQWNLSNFSCEVKGQDCLTNPSDILIHENKMYIADTGNSRVKIKDSVIEYGCDPEVFPGNLTPIQCSFDRVLGKKDFNDFVDYNISQGYSSLSQPVSIDVNNDIILIADSGHDRVVWKKDVSDTLVTNCSDSNWQTSLCGWDGVLGQPDYTTTEYFIDLFNNDNNILGDFFYNVLQFETNWFNNHINNPKKVKFFTNNDELKIMVSSNEDFNYLTPLGIQVALQSRLLIFEDTVFDNCNSLTFNSGECNSSLIIGQENFDKILVLAGSNLNEASYNSIPYGLFDINDFYIFDNKLLVVDSFANEVYYWEDFLNSSSLGSPPSFRIQNPKGETDPLTNIISPDLKGLSGISVNETSGQVLISDSIDGKLYILNLFNSL